jgi:hypothetical protein
MACIEYTLVVQPQNMVKAVDNLILELRDAAVQVACKAAADRRYMVRIFGCLWVNGVADVENLWIILPPLCSQREYQRTSSRAA